MESSRFLLFSAVEAWAALVEKGGLDPYNCCNKRVLIHAGSGGFGSIAIQLVKGKRVNGSGQSEWIIRFECPSALVKT